MKGFPGSPKIPSGLSHHLALNRPPCRAPAPRLAVGVAVRALWVGARDEAGFMLGAESVGIGASSTIAVEALLRPPLSGGSFRHACTTATATVVPASAASRDSCEQGDAGRVQLEPAPFVTWPGRVIKSSLCDCGRGVRSTRTAATQGATWRGIGVVWISSGGD